ncbi:MAG TPA: DNA repair protein RadC [Candidatus Polarisedimenticolaceae bacterium]
MAFDPDSFASVRAFPVPPRRRTGRLDAGRASSADLLARLFGGGEPSRRAASSLLRRESLRGLAALPVEVLAIAPGLGRARAERLAAALELGRRVYGPEPLRERPRLTRPAEVYRVVAGLAKARRERLVALYLDAQNGLIHREVVSLGSLNVTRTAPREIFHPAIVHGALAVVLAHNHPSGCLEPSTEDVEFTRGVQRAGALLGIELYDHLIVAGPGYTSLRERGAW